MQQCDNRRGIKYSGQSRPHRKAADVEQAAPNLLVRSHPLGMVYEATTSGRALLPPRPAVHSPEPGPTKHSGPEAVSARLIADLATPAHDNSSYQFVITLLLQIGEAMTFP